MNENIKGTLKINMYSDGDFGFHNLENIKNDGWVIWHDDDSYRYTFRLENFVGDGYELASKVNVIFEEIHTHRIYIMQEICEIFEKIESNCESDDMRPELYFDHGNQTYEATFNFKSTDEKDNILAEIKNYEYRIDYWKDQINDCNNEITKLKNKLEEL